MTKTYTERALVPDATRSKLLVVDGDAPALPSWTLEDPDFVDSIREARARVGITSPFLRVVRLQGDPVLDAELRTLIEFDAVPPDWELPQGLVWMALDDARRVGLAAEPFAADVSAWIDQLASGGFPELRPDWARPGWLEAMEGWLTGRLAQLGRAAQGPVEQLGSWAISCLLAVNTDRGRVVTKSVPELFRHEPALTKALGEEHPGQVPAVIVADPERRLLMMEAFGGEPLGSEDPARWADGLVELAGIQRAWIGRRGDADRIGVEDRTLAALDAELESIIGNEDDSPGLARADRESLVANLPRYRELIGRLAAGPIPETLVHGDFHPWNVQRDGDHLVIYDWSDACWGHPFFDVGTFTSRIEDTAARETMRGAYLATWADYGDPVTLRGILDSATPLTELHLAISWRRIRAVFEPDGAFPFVDTGAQRHLEFALAATDEVA